MAKRSPPSRGVPPILRAKEPAILHEGTKSRRTGEKSPAARQLADWFRQLDRFVRATRTFGPDAPNVGPMRERLTEDLLQHIGFHAPLLLRCTALEIWLQDEIVVAGPEAGDEGGARLDRRVPFLLYRDGIRTIEIAPNATPDDIAALLDAIVVCASGRIEHEDMVSMLWAVDLTGLRFEVAPLESSLLVQTHQDAPLNSAAGALGGDAGTGQEQVDFDDWFAPDTPADAGREWQALESVEVAATRDWLARLKQDAAQPWPKRSAEIVRTARHLEPGASMNEAIGSVVVGWLGEAIEHGRWQEALEAYEALPHDEGDAGPTARTLQDILAGLDADGIAEKLDESEPEAQGTFFALAVHVGRPALDLVVAVLARATRPRLRAAATTALGYICSEQPRLLAPYLTDSRWHVVRNIVFTLGQIGGDEVADILATAAHHHDIRVRRAVVHALGQVSERRRIPLLVSQLGTPDHSHLAAVLAMLTRAPDDHVAEALLAQIAALDFESRPPESRVALLAALGDTASDRAIPTLQAMVLKGGWFARRTPERSAAASTLARIGSPVAIAVLQDGLQSRAEAVRAACQEALTRRERVA